MEGDTGDSLYIVSEGTAVATKAGLLGEPNGIHCFGCGSMLYFCCLLTTVLNPVQLPLWVRRPRR